MTDILLLEDDALQLKILSRQLEGLGYENVVGCTAASQALAVLTNSRREIGLIFVDLNLPGIDGIAFLRLLAQRHCDAAVILVSGEDPRLVSAAVKIAAEHQLRILGALAKPVWTADLKTMLLQWSAPSAPARPSAHTPEQIANAIRGGELVNYYQPIVDLNHGAIAGCEALVRWRHPQEGLLPPGAFIDLAESHGFIHELTTTVLIGALRQSAAWRADGLRVPVAINVSMLDLDRLDFLDLLTRQADAFGIPPTEIAIEVTEPRLSVASRNALELLGRLRLRRFAVALDDFGTGQSSLPQLRELPFSSVKVDRAFVHGAAEDATLDVVLASCVKTAKHLGMRTVAEGVEDDADWRWARERGCDAAQGFFVGAPMPAADVPGWLETWERRRGALFR
jgi:EAL domain-containing protein (putative c-di-GMP-specific phosphodiesterase class I)/ActR/RegA family two-component response regulator